MRTTPSLSRWRRPLQLSRDQRNEASGKDSRRAEADPAQPLVELSQPFVDLIDPFAELLSLRPRLLEDALKSRVNGAHAVVKSFVSPPGALHCTPLSVRRPASRPDRREVSCAFRDARVLGVLRERRRPLSRWGRPLQLRRNQRDEPGGEDPRRAEPDPAQPLVELTQPSVDLIDPLLEPVDPFA
jgi:hypothetical protein